ncbi:MAG: DNA primase [Hydrogenibacillus schlegelii]|nr:DNA primase [Hydrogenibacillus schlegelii]
MARLPEELVERVRAASDIVDVVGEYVALKKRGRSYMGLCPFHPDRTPSLSVVPDQQFFHCFGCHIGGDVFRFIMEIEGMSFPEAVKHLADRAGIPLPDLEYDDEAGRRKNRLKEAHALATRYYHYVLNASRHGETAKEYVHGRGIRPETVERHRLGYAPETGDALVRFLQKRGFGREEIVAAGLGVEEGGRLADRFVGRLMIPLEDIHGAVVGFSGRRLDGGSPKYVNSPETPIFKKGRFLFHLGRAKAAIRRLREVVVVEGHLDALLLAQEGLENVVAAQGTAFTPDMAELLGRYAERVILAFDGDEAGERSAERAAPILLQRGLDVKVARLPEGLDPDAYVRAYGIDAFRLRVLQGAESYGAFRLERLKRGLDLDDAADRARYLEQAARAIAELSNPFEREAHMEAIVKAYAVPKDLFQESVRRHLEARARKAAEAPPYDRFAGGIHSSDAGGRRRRPRTAYEAAEARLLQEMLARPERISEIMDAVGGGWITPEGTALAAELYALFYEGIAGRELVPKLMTALEEPALKDFLTELLLEEAPPLSPAALADLVATLQVYPKENELKALYAERSKALDAGDFARAREIEARVRAVRSEIERLRRRA